jgi:predicted 3-demethylubiquinone-9 3-methyltransferase (glyoxalase superfamily)
MNKKIIPHLWFDTQAKEATAFYTTVFPDSKVKSVTTISSTPSGDSDIVQFTLAGLDFMAISAGPYFKLNPSVSLFAVFNSDEEIDEVWKKLSEGGTVLMEYNTYPWAKKYGWLKDKYGLSWQLSYSEHHQMEQKIAPLLMFTQAVAGKTKEALEYYTSIFPDSKIEMAVPYEKGEGDVEGYIKHARFTLGGANFMAMDSSGPHAFTFNEAFSFVVNCDTQEEIDAYWDKLSAVPASEQCGWCKDKYGVSWQIVPRIMAKLMTSGDTERTQRVVKAFMPMKKLDIKKLEEAYEGE